jgi:hypothetical protein
MRIATFKKQRTTISRLTGFGSVTKTMPKAGRWNYGWATNRKRILETMSNE